MFEIKIYQNFEFQQILISHQNLENKNVLEAKIELNLVKF